MKLPPIQCVHVLLKPDLAPKHLEALQVALQEAQMDYDFLIPPKSNPHEALLCLGGDGTLLGALRHSSAAACFGIHVGRLGFLSATNLEGTLEFLKALKEGRYSLHQHLMLEAHMGKPPRTFLCANDIVVAKKDFYGILELQLFIDQTLANVYQVDGLIIATPLGSTAYNISVGGSVVHPLCQNILITPIAPHSLNERPLILGAHARLEIVAQKSCVVVLDGQSHHALRAHQVLKVQASTRQATLLQPLNRNYFKVLKEKFSWGLKELPKGNKI
ncbi:Putative inorganic polyphosphate/ATP-NAD kinase PpnK [Helicobacter bizzozeronii]|uniref:NAD(+)/NADH kinase n=1 Tax=Helicobacter bizzozeronii TaxID=56877 RepID=UPI00244D85D1|nr:NAD(+)/NADH kinase [Helicobacter bizzozeronii]GMB92685.1 Putative inorganic polyphosphate/ATP-NAD kinase PpnK [Helicobacter bizzozeronii]